MLVEVQMRPLPLGRLQQQLPRQLSHLGPVAPNSHDEAALPPPLVAREDLRVEERLARRHTAEHHVRGADLLAQQASVLAVAGRENAERHGGPALALLEGGGDYVKFAQNGVCAGGEGAGYEVDVLDCVPAREEGEADVPVGLEAGSEGGEGLDGAALGEEAGGGEGGAEGREVACVEETYGAAGG